MLIVMQKYNGTDSVSSSAFLDQTAFMLEVQKILQRFLVHYSA